METCLFLVTIFLIIMSTILVIYSNTKNGKGSEAAVNGITALVIAICLMLIASLTFSCYIGMLMGRLHGN